MFLQALRTTARYSGGMRHTLTPSTAVLLVIAPLLWAGNAVVGRLVHDLVPPITLNFLRWLLAFVLLLPLAGLVGLLAGIAMLDRRGVPVSGLLTGAGVAGLAVSLAAQSTLNNLIAGITLVLERPFGIGDYIVLGDCEGTVEDISFRSTRIRSPDNVAITIENSKITAEYIQNYDSRQSRLWKFTIGLTYDTPREKIEHLTADLTAMLQAQPDVQPDGVTIALDKFNDYSIDLACRVYITKVNLRDFMQVKNTLNLQILDLMQEEGCEFAFPTTTVDLPERK